MSINKKELYYMIDNLPEPELLAAKKFIEFLLSNTGKNLRMLSKHLANPIYDEEPLTEEEIIAIKEGEKDIEEGRAQSLEEIMKELVYRNI